MPDRGRVNPPWSTNPHAEKEDAENTARNPDIPSDHRPPFFAESFKSTGTVEIFFSPNSGATDAIVREEDAAKTKVIVQAYSFTSKPMLRHS
jgi:hypothetical protein